VGADQKPRSAHQWVAKNARETIPDAHTPGKMHRPTMLTTDLALRFDPAFEKISRHFHDNPDAFAHAFAEAWYKLTHRDMGNHARLLGPDVPAEPRLWQDPLPPAQTAPLTEAEIATLKQAILGSGLSISRLVATAWASASTYRGSDKRGGANGARIRLAPQKDWAVNEPIELAKALATLEDVRSQFIASTGKSVSIADTIVLGGCAAIEAAARKADHGITVPFTPGRVDANADQTDADSFAPLEPSIDGFRNYAEEPAPRSLEAMLVDRAQLLTLSAPEMTVLVAGLRVLGANVGGSQHGVFTDRPETLSNDFLKNLLKSSTELTWEPTPDGSYVAKNRQSGDGRWTGTRVDLIFGANAQLRALAEAYATADAEQTFVEAFVKAWVKVMDLDRVAIG
jgi:catalase-peroxidase